MDPMFVAGRNSFSGAVVDLGTMHLTVSAADGAFVQPSYFNQRCPSVSGEEIIEQNKKDPLCQSEFKS